MKTTFSDTLVGNLKASDIRKFKRFIKEISDHYEILSQIGEHSNDCPPIFEMFKLTNPPPKIKIK